MGPETSEFVQLEIRLGDGERRGLPLEKDLYSLGRAPNNDLSYPDDVGLSRHHMVLERKSNGWSVRDLGSKNGTQLNGQLLQGSAVLHSGDLITCGQITLAFAPPRDRTVVFSPSGMA